MQLIGYCLARLVANRIFQVLGLGLIILILGIIISNAPSIDQTPHSSVPEKPIAELIDFDWDSSGPIRKIVGTVHNNSSRTIPMIMVEFTLLDSSKATVGNTHDTVFNLEPNGNWHFKAAVFVAEARYARPEPLRGKWY
jgi:hypothetical protein